MFRSSAHGKDEVVEEYDHERLFRVASFAEIPGLLL